MTDGMKTAAFVMAVILVLAAALLYVNKPLRCSVTGGQWAERVVGGDPTATGIVARTAGMHTVHYCER